MSISKNPEPEKNLEEGSGMVVTNGMVIDAIGHFLNARTYGDLKEAVGQHPEMLLPEVEQVLLAMAGQKNDAASRMIRERTDFLIRCREVGVEQAFNEKADPLGLQPYLEEVERLTYQAIEDPRFFGPTIEVYKRMLERLPPGGYLKTRAGFLNAMGIAYSRLTTGERAANIAQAIQCHQEVTRLLPLEVAPLEYADAQLKLARLYQELPSGNRRENLAQALNCYHEALRVYTPETAPKEYAQIQAALGDLFSQ